MNTKLTVSSEFGLLSSNTKLTVSSEYKILFPLGNKINELQNPMIFDNKEAK